MQKLRQILFNLFLTKEQERLNKEVKKYKDLCAKMNVTRLMRKQLAGFDIREIDDTSTVLERYPDEDMSLLTNVHELTKNKALDVVVTYLIRSQILKIAKEAETMESVLFSRGTINGLVLLKEEIASLDVEYIEKHKRDGTYDQHDVI